MDALTHRCALRHPRHSHAHRLQEAPPRTPPRAQPGAGGWLSASHASSRWRQRQPHPGAPRPPASTPVGSRLWNCECVPGARGPFVTPLSPRPSWVLPCPFPSPGAPCRTASLYFCSELCGASVATVSLPPSCSLIPASCRSCCQETREVRTHPTAPAVAQGPQGDTNEQVCMGGLGRGPYLQRGREGSGLRHDNAC